VDNVAPRRARASLISIVSRRRVPSSSMFMASLAVPAAARLSAANPASNIRLNCTVGIACRSARTIFSPLASWVRCMAGNFTSGCKSG
jgi:hypothetical protein